MSTDVFVEVVRKNDYCPIGKFFLGGNGTKNALFDVEMDEVTYSGRSVKAFINAESVTQFLDKYADDFYSNNDVEEIDKYLMDINRDDFAYWLTMEY